MFRAVTSDWQLPRVFGGQVLAQGLYAAGRTVDDRLHVHSMHAYFLRPGGPDAPISYAVQNTRDSKAFSSRTVEAEQHDQVIFTLAASFHSGESGLEHQAGRPSAPEPEGLDQSSVHPALRERVATQWPGWEFTFVPLAALDAARPGHTQVWIRFRERLPDVPLMHACALVYASDMTLISSTLKVNGHQPAQHGMQLASLDHAVWFHRSFRADDWLLFDQQADAGSEGRGLASARVFTRDGALVATVMQEGLLRPPR